MDFKITLGYPYSLKMIPCLLIFSLLTLVCAETNHPQNQSQFSTELIEYSEESHNQTSTKIATYTHIEESCNEKCLRKCCQVNDYYKNECIPNDLTDTLYNMSKINETDYDWAYGFPPRKKDRNYTCLFYDLDEVIILDSGEIQYGDEEIYLSANDSCIEQVLNNDKIVVIQVALCLKQHGLPKQTFVSNYFIIAGHVISCVFLLILIIGHLCSHTLRTNLHGKCFASMCFSLFLAFITFLIQNTLPDGELPVPLCVITAILGIYFSLCFWSWMCMRCYETFRIIRGTVNAVPLCHLDSGNERFFIYSAICWGGPLLISIFTVIMQVSPNVPSNISPGIANGKCWIQRGILACLMYYYGYEFITHILNFVFMGICIYYLRKSGAAFQCCIKQEKPILVVHNKSNLQMFWQQFYIFVTYVAYLSLDTIDLVKPKSQLWRWWRIFNCFQGVILFSIFMVNHKAVRNYLRSCDRPSNMFRTLVTMLSTSSNVTSTNDQVELGQVSNTHKTEKNNDKQK